MGKKGQILMVIVWILVILTVLAVTLGHRVSMALKMSSFRRDAVECLALAKAGISRAAAEIEQDKNKYDSLLESWAGNEPLFSKIPVPGESRGFATQRVWGMIDEERKININTVSGEVLLVLLGRNGIPDPARLARNILIWRGSLPDADKVYDELGYTAKGQPFGCVEELKVVRGMSGEYYEELKDSVTVYGSGEVNINTVSRETLGILCGGIAVQLSLDTGFGKSVADKIVRQREVEGFWGDIKEINIPLTTAEEQNIFNRLTELSNCVSENFLIEASGNIGKIKKTVTAVYNKKKHLIVSWHER
ncbi:MAG: type II secretion system protein GspK [Candidatus Omnitrophica bacterium]|nr:type II secretion system protein GspK [Candidatus Omnitrophota bacterium]